MAKLLIVDDDSDMVDACAEVLRLEGHSVRVALNGAEGLARIEEAIPDLILCDVEMPVLDGPDMAFRMFVRDAGKEKIPILMTSGVANLRRVAAKVGTPYFLSKPFSLEQLVAMVVRALAERIPPSPGL